MGSWLYPRPASLIEIEGSGVLEGGEDGATGTRIAVVDANQLFAAVNYLLGDVVVNSDGEEQRIGADEWPGFPLLRASRVRAEPHGRMGSSTWETGPYYEKAKLTISYKVDKANEDDSNNNPEDQTNLIQSLDYACEIMTVPMKVGSPGNPLVERKTVMRHIRLPTIIYSCTIPRKLRPNWDLIRESVAHVNSDTIFGGPPGTVLFDGPHAEREIKMLSKNFWKLNFKFIYNPHGWNKTLNPETLQWEDACAVSSEDNKPYPETALKALLR